jgi:hypothetical protein
MRKLGQIACVLFSIEMVCLAAACVATPMSGTVSKDVSQERVTLKLILDNPAEFSGKAVHLSGVFKGWQGACKNLPPKTRSDWMLEDGTGCIYVHGTPPRGLKPMSPKDEPVTVKAIVRLASDGFPYLEITSP